MSGAGTGPAGATAAGKDPTTSTPKVVGTYDGRYVPLYDLRTRSFPRGADNKVKLVHWVDQTVALAMGVSNGTLVSVPSLGNTLRKIQRAAGPRVVAEAEDAVRIALRSLVDRHDIGVTKVEVVLPARGQIVVLLTYINLRLYPAAENIFQFIY